MISDKELIAQNELGADLLVQALHITRVWIFIPTILVYFNYGFMKAVVFYVFLFFIMYKLLPVKINDKDRCIHFMLLKYLDKLYVFGMRNIIKFLRWYMAMLIVKTAVAEQLPPPPEGVPPVPPPPQSTEPPKPEVIKKDAFNMKASEVVSIITSEEIKRLIIRQQYNIEFGGTKKYYLKDTNYFSYHPDIPILIRFDKPIRRILMLTEGAKVVYEDNYLFLAPPQEEDGKLFGFVVVFEDGETSYFAGERVSFIDTQDIYKLDKVSRDTLGLDGKKKEAQFKPKKRQVITYYIYKSPTPMLISDVIEVFLRDRKRCPVDGEMFTYQGQTYKFIRKQEKIIKEDDEVYACGFVFKLVDIK